MNNVQILGTITRDIELIYTQTGNAIAKFSIAYNEKWKDAQGQMQEKAHFFDVSVFGKQAETINQYFAKGSRILIDGSLDFQSWEKDGQKHSKVSIKMNGFSFIDRKSDNQANQQQYNAQQPQQYQQQPQQYNAPQMQYQDANKRPVTQQQYQANQQQYQQQQPQQNNSIDINDDEIPF